MLRAGWVKARWDTSPSGRRVRVYAITPDGPGAARTGSLELRAHARRHPARPGAGEAMNLLRRLLERRRLERDLAEEIRQHLDEKIDELVADGLSREQAVRAGPSRVRQRTLIEERGREVWRWHLVEDAWADLRYATAPVAAHAGLHVSPRWSRWRLASAPIRPSSAWSTASCCGRCRFPRPIALSRSSRSIGVPDRPTASRTRTSSIFAGARARCRTSPSYRGTDFTLTGRGLPVHLRGQIVSWEFFQTLDVAPALGRGFLPADEQPGSRVVVLSHDTWTQHFGGDAAIVGQAIASAARRTWSPASRLRGFRSRSSGSRPTRGRRWRTMRRPTRARRSPSSAARGCSTRSRGWLRESRSSRRAPRWMPSPPRCCSSSPTTTRTSRPPMCDPRSTGSSGRCAKASCCSGARSRWCCSSRAPTCPTCWWRARPIVKREFDVRLALGGSRRRIVRQLVVENLLLGVCGSVAGVAVAYAGAAADAATGRRPASHRARSRIDGRVLMFAALVAVGDDTAGDPGAGRPPVRAGPYPAAADDGPDGGRGPSSPAGRDRDGAGGGQPGAAERRDAAGLRPRAAARPRSRLSSRTG